MDPNTIRDALCLFLTKIQESSGRSVPDLSGSVCPMGGLDGFDSFNCIEAATALSSYFGCAIRDDVALFTRQGRPRTVDEIVQDLCQIISSREEE